MNGREMHFEIKRKATRAINTGWHIDINTYVPYISVEGPLPNQDFFFKGKEAKEMLHEANRAADKYDVHAYEYILWELG